jgi:predicted RNase H-like nuclease
VRITGSGRLSWRVAGRFDELLSANAGVGLVLVDIPIGLPSDGARRACDVEARSFLGGPRASSVFPVPCRSALRADHPSRVNCRVTGRKLSRQTLGILPRIAEVDAYLRSRKGRGPIVRETHPEVCFLSLDPGRRLPSKSTPEGRAARAEILCRRGFDAAAVVQEVVTQWPRRHVGTDDVLDAFVAAVTGLGRLATLPARPPRDAAGRRMEIVYPAGSAGPPTKQR